MSDITREKCKELYALTPSLQAVADQLGTSMGTVQRRLAGWEGMRPPGVSGFRTYPWPTTRRIQAVVRLVQSLYRNGWTRGEIADRLEYSEARISQFLRTVEPEDAR